MADLNTSVLQNVQPVQIQDPLERYNNFQRAQYMMSQNALNQVQLNQTNAMNKLFATPGAIDPKTGLIDSDVARSVLSANGAGAVLPKILQANQDYAKAKAETASAQAEATGKGLDNLRNGYTGLLSVDPNDPTTLKAYQDLHDKSGQLLGADPAVTAAGDAAAQKKFQLSQNWNPKAHGLPAGTPSPFQQLLAESSKSADQYWQNYRTQQTNATSQQNAQMAASATRYAADQHLKGVKIEAGTSLQRTQMEQHGENLRMQAGQADQQLDPAYTTAVAARQDMALNNKILGLLNSGAPAGPGKPLWQKIGQMLNASPIPIHIPGVSDTDTVAKGQAYVKYLAQNLMTTMPEHMRNLAAPELTAMANANPGQGMAPEAVKSVLGFKKQLDQYQVEQYRQLWGSQPKEIQPMLSRKQMNPLYDTSDTNHFNPEAVANLRAHPETAHHFDAVFGPGSAEQILGGF